MERSGTNVQLLLGGDVMTGRGIDQVLAQPGSPQLFEPYVCDAREYVRLAEQASGSIETPLAPACLWGEALALMDRFPDALRIVNLETSVTASDEAWPGKGIHYRMHPGNMECLLAARLAAVSLANNHVLDWGRAGLAETLASLERAGLRSAGAGLDEASARTPAVLPVAGGGRLLFSAWALTSSGVPEDWAATATRSGIALLPDLSEDSAAQVAETIAALRGPGDLAIASLHWGGNWGFHIPSAHRAFAHRLIDLGAADVVHGHSSHHPLPIEVYRERPILYGCGDLLNDYEGIGGHGSLRCDCTCLYLLTLAASGALQALEIFPLQLCRFRLQEADATARAWLSEIFQEKGKPLGTDIAFTGQGRFRLRW
jgi:poly-gamma-glutamate capsule biosynthesis protein CapA/YwtB (metallophosphatase superfamily)